MTAQADLLTRAPHRRSIWGLVWRLAAALAAGTMLFGIVILSYDELETRYPSYATAFAVHAFVDFALGIVTLCLLPFRRKAPLTIALVSAALGAVTTFGFGAISIVMISLATRRRPKEITLVAAMTLLAATASAWILPDPEQQFPLWQVLIAMAAYFCLCVMIGMYIGGRRELYVSLQDRARLAETEQAARLESAQSAERTRIAREMHDVLAHRLSLVAMHSGALAYRDDLTREETASTAAVVRDNAHLALSELREVLGVLRDDSGDGARAPQPTLAALPELLDQNAVAGSVVRSRIAPAVAEALSTLPDSTARNAFRIIQESLTNARRHAPGSTVELDIDGAPGERLTVRVSNSVVEGGTTQSPPGGHSSSPLPSSGLGLPGLVERARLAGGELTFGIENGRFTVTAWLPWTA